MGDMKELSYGCWTSLWRKPLLLEPAPALQFYLTYTNVIKRVHLLPTAKVFSFLLEEFVTYDDIPETVAHMMHFTHPLRKSPTEYNEALCNRAHWWDGVYDEYVLKRHFIEGLLEFFRQSTCLYWGYKTFLFYEMARHLTFSKKIHIDSHNTNAPGRNENAAIGGENDGRNGIRASDVL